jgi:glycosyltransferase involved in cell wall biosynthesis
MSYIIYVNPTAIHGGAEEALLCMMLVMQQQGYLPVLVVPHAGWLTEQSRVNGIPCELLPTLPDTMVTEEWSAQFKPWILNGIALSQLVRKWRAVLVHSNTPRSSYHGGLGARLARVPAVTHMHDIVNLPTVGKRRARLIGSLADQIIVPSEAVAQVVRSHMPWATERIHTVYNGRDIAMYSGVDSIDLHGIYNLPAGTITIGSVSAMTAWKGQDVLIDAFRTLYAQDKRLRLFIVGGAQGAEQQRVYEASLHERVAAYGLSDLVIFTGWREDSWAFIKSLDIFVHVPTKPDPLPTVVLHACALGRPIIGSDTGGIPEMVINEQNGLIVPPADVVTLSKALNRMINDYTLRERLGSEARHHFERYFSSQRMEQALKTIYQQRLAIYPQGNRVKSFL